MPHLSEFTEYKKKVLNLIVKDKTCVELITATSNPTLPATSLINKQLFLYDYIDETVTDEKVYICVETDEGDVKGPAVTGVHLWIYVIVPKSMMNMSGEIRRDAHAGQPAGHRLLSCVRDVSYQRWIFLLDGPEGNRVPVIEGQEQTVKKLDGFRNR